MVFNEENYPNMVGLFQELGVAAEKTDMSFRYHRHDGTTATFWAVACVLTSWAFNGSPAVLSGTGVTAWHHAIVFPRVPLRGLCCYWLHTGKHSSLEELQLCRGEKGFGALTRVGTAVHSFWGQAA